MCLPVIYMCTQSVTCIIQMLFRIVASILCTIENVVRLVLQMAYSLLSVLVQTLALLPICLVFLVTSNLRCLLCGGGRSGCGTFGFNHCRMGDCLMCIFILAIIYYISLQTGYLDTFLHMLGYVRDPHRRSARRFLSPPEVAHDTTTESTVSNFMDQFNAERYWGTSTENSSKELGPLPAVMGYLL